MKRIAYLIITAVLFLTLIPGCISERIIVPTDSTDIVLEMLMSKIWVFEIDGQIFEFNFSDWIENERRGQTIPDGTDMTADRCRQYFAVRIVDYTFPHDKWMDRSYKGYPVRCWIYKFLDGDGVLGKLESLTDDQIFAFVRLIEESGRNIPDGPPPFDLC